LAWSAAALRYAACCCRCWPGRSNTPGRTGEPLGLEKLKEPEGKLILTSIDFDTFQVGQRVTVAGDVTQDKTGRLVVFAQVQRMGERWSCVDFVQANCPIPYTTKYGARARVTGTVTKKFDNSDGKWRYLGFLMLDNCTFSGA
jgi:hypothetical protein